MIHRYMSNSIFNIYIFQLDEVNPGGTDISIVNNVTNVSESDPSNNADIDIANPIHTHE